MIKGYFGEYGIFNNTVRNYLDIGEDINVLCVGLFVIIILLLSD